jgi:hypothetical protein
MNVIQQLNINIYLISRLLNKMKYYTIKNERHILKTLSDKKLHTTRG